MGVDNGHLGSVYVGASKIAEINNWTGNFSTKKEVITAFGDKGERRQYTITDATGSFSGNSDWSDSGQNALLTQHFSGGTPAAAFLYLYVSGGSGYYGNALVDVGKTANAGGLISFDATFDQSEQWLTNIA